MCIVHLYRAFVIFVVNSILPHLQSRMMIFEYRYDCINDNNNRMFHSSDNNSMT